MASAELEKCCLESFEIWAKKGGICVCQHSVCVFSCGFSCDNSWYLLDSHKNSQNRCLDLQQPGPAWLPGFSGHLEFLCPQGMPKIGSTGEGAQGCWNPTDCSWKWWKMKRSHGALDRLGSWGEEKSGEVNLEGSVVDESILRTPWKFLVSLISLLEGFLFPAFSSFHSRFLNLPSQHFSNLDKSFYFEFIFNFPSTAGGFCRAQSSLLTLALKLLKDYFE